MTGKLSLELQDWLLHSEEPEKKEMEKRYLGDSVYAEFDGYGITLTTENGYGPSNIIYLEPQVLAALENYKAYLTGEPK